MDARLPHNLNEAARSESALTRRCRAALGAFAAIGGLLALMGWIADVPRLMDWEGAGITMKANTAMAAMAAGIALIVSLGVATSATSRTIVTALGVLVALIGGVTLTQHITGWNAGIDTLLFDEPTGSPATSSPGRMGVPASTSFLLMGTALAMLTHPGTRGISAALGAAVVFIGTLSVVVRLYDAQLMYMLPRLTGIAVQTASMILALGVGLVMSVPEREPMTTLRADTSAGTLVRRALPLVIVLPIAIGWVRVQGEAAGLYDFRFGAAARTLTEMALLTWLVWWAALAVRRHEEPLRHSEKALRSSEAVLQRQSKQLAAHLETAAIYLHRVGPDGIILWANEAELRALGYAREEYIGRHIAEFHVDPDVVADMLARWERNERLQEYEARMKCKDGSIRTVLIDSSVMWEAGRFLHTQCFARDITERKRADEVKTLLAEIVEASDDAIISKSLDGVIRSWNSGAERLFGYSVEEAVGQRIHLIVPRELHDEERSILERLSRGERIEHFETTRVSKDGLRIPISLTVSPIRDGSGRVIGASKVARDITERKRADAALRDSESRLQQAVEEARVELVQNYERMRLTERMAGLGTLSAGLGHDMANLLMPVRARLDAMTAQGDPAQSENIQSIRKSIEYMHNLATSLRMLAIDPMDASRAENRLDIRKWWGQSSLLLKNALPRGVVLEGAFPENLPTLRIASHQLAQAVFNLVQNASDALRRIQGPDTPAGKVRVWAELDSQGGANMVRLGVSDTGPGMTDEIKAHCMEPFYSTKPRTISTGMGLTLVHGIIQQSGGTITIESQIGKGSTFILSLPTWPDNAPATGDASRIACVELKDLRMRAFIGLVLQSTGYQIHNQPCADDDVASIWVTDAGHASLSHAKSFLQRGDDRRIVVVGNGLLAQDNGDHRITHIPGAAKPAEIRSRLVAVAQSLRAGGMHGE